MNKRRVVQDVQHELFPIRVVLIQDVPGTRHALVEGSPIKNRRLVVSDIASKMMRKFA